MVWKPLAESELAGAAQGSQLAQVASPAQAEMWGQYSWLDKLA